MARKSIEFEVVFHFPRNDEGKRLLAKAIGDVHTKAIKGVIDKNISDINKKNKIITEVQNKLLKQKLDRYLGK
jgi:hypothetical protein